MLVKVVRRVATSFDSVVEVFGAVAESIEGKGGSA